MMPIKCISRNNVTVLLLILTRNVYSESHIEDDLQIYPADAPVSMMERLNIGKDLHTKNIVELKTSLGIITGLKEPTLPPHHNNAHMFAFRGIPYANAPVGKLRLSDPVDLVKEWPEKRLSATKFKPICPQYDTETNTVLGAEDCLYLNIYTPSLPGPEHEHEKTLHPVFVFIHGGGFIRGSSSAHGAEKLLTRDLLVVTINYRLGALGYLSTKDSVLPGNYGLLDQVSALRWIQKNIAEFGGDPKQITLGGFSAGASSTHIHMFSPLSQNLFHQAILMSGTSLLKWVIRSDPLTPAKLLATKLECSVKASTDISSCLADKTVHQIVSAQASLYRYEFFPVWFVPTIDNGLRSTPILPRFPEEMDPRPMPTIVGSVPLEGLLFAAPVILMAEDPRNATKTYDEVARYTMCPWPYPEFEETMKDLAEAFYYSKHAKTSRGLLLEQLTELLTDFGFGYGIWDAAATLADKGAPVYTYLMTHRHPETPTWALPLYKKLEEFGYHTPILKEGVSHGDDLIHVFAFPHALGKGSDRDHQITQIMLSLFANFIIYGSPQEDLSFPHLKEMAEWRTVKAGGPVGFYNISVNPSMVYTPYRVKEQNFWRSLVPRPKFLRNSQPFKKPSEEL